ncbi:MAG: FecR domain-containing protein [Halofilum sp. (in: g-proteobacteria)]|nr:FecR domain-containing protein [Halofilum sp. (in: g-proteobacteria)]
MRRARRTALPLLLAGVLALAAGVAPAQESIDELPQERILYVAPGQSLTGLVRELYPERPGDWRRIERWIVDNNPHAFPDGDAAQLRGDVRVRLPHPSALARRQSAAPGPAPAQLQFGGRYLFVDPAQSLAELVPKLYPDARDRWDAIIDAIIERNAQALASRDAETEIGRGTRLSIPAEPPAKAAVADDARPAPEPVVGEAAAVTGRVVARGRHGRNRVLAEGDPVRRHDTLETAAEGRAELHFRDGERVTLRPESELRIRAWHLPDVGPGQRVFELVAGGLRAVTGAIGNRGEDDYRMITPNVTMGVRGTAYALRLCGQGECRLGDTEDAAAVPPGLYLGVDQGRVAVLNASAEVEFAAGEFGYVAGPATEPVAADADIAGIVYTAAERSEITLAEGPHEPEEEGTSWWWAVGGALLLGLAL